MEIPTSEPGSAPSSLAPSQPASRAGLIAVAAVVLLHVVLAWMARPPGILTGQDDAEYITLSQSILQGGYNELFRADAPVHRTYPPGYPAALAMWSLAAGDSFDAAVALNIGLSAMLLLVLFMSVRRAFDERIAVLATTLLAINPEIVRSAGSIVSEPLYVLLTLLGLATLQRPRPRAQTIFAALVLALLAALTRTGGVTMIVALVLHWMLERRWKLVGSIAAAGTIAAVGWILWASRGPSPFVGASYAAELAVLWRGLPWTGPLPTRALSWGRAYLVDGIPWQLGAPTVAGTAIDNIVSLVVGMACAIAGFVALWRRWRAAAIYVAVYAGMLVAWLYYVDRFVLPIVPLLVVMLLAGAAAIGGRLGARTMKLAPVLVAAVLAIGSAARTSAFVQSRAPCHDSPDGFPPVHCMTQDQASFFDALRWIDANTAADAIILTAKPGALWLYTGRHAPAYEEAIHKDETTFIDWLRDGGTRWILLASLHNREPSLLAPLMLANCDRLRVASAFPPRTWLFEIETGLVPEARAADGACAAIEAYLAASDGRETEVRN